MDLRKILSDEIPPEIMKKAKIELHETEQVKIQSLKKLKELIYGEADFEPFMEDSFLLRFLRQKKFKVSRAFASLKRYYAFKSKYSRILTDFKPSELRPIFDLHFAAASEYQDGEGSGVLILRPEHFEMRKFSIDDYLSCGAIYAEVALQSECVQIAGFSIILDYTNFSLTELRHFATPKILYRLFSALQDYVPCRVKAIHVVNEPAFGELLYNTVKIFFPKKIQERVHIHGKNYISLHNYIPQEILPEELGGKQGTFLEMARKFNEMAFELEDRIALLNMYGYKKKPNTLN